MLLPDVSPNICTYYLRHNYNYTGIACYFDWNRHGFSRMTAHVANSHTGRYGRIAVIRNKPPTIKREEEENKAPFS